MNTPILEQIDAMEAGPDMDAFIAEHIFGFEVVDHAWPCGIGYDDCTWSAHSYPDEEPAPYQDTLRPVYKGPHSTWPAIKVSYVEGVPPHNYVDVEPVPFYSTEIASAFEVVKHLENQGPKGYLNLNLIIYAYHRTYAYFGAEPIEYDETKYGEGNGEHHTSVAICRAALKCVLYGEQP